MIPQIRDAPPAEDNMYTVLHNFDIEQLYNFQHRGLVSMIGSFVGIFLSGIAATLGISSVLLVISKRDKGISRRDYFMCAYTVLLLFVLLALETQSFVGFNATTIWFFQPQSRLSEHILMLSRLVYVTGLVLLGLTDGLLVLRCFLVQRVLGRDSSKWAHLFWVLPACMWVITVVSVTMIAINPYSTNNNTPGVLALTSNLTLNVYATLFITIRLFLHRRIVMAYFGDKGLATQHICVISILLESAAINIPAMIFALICSGPVEDLILPIGVASQVLAATLIIYRTALGRVFNQETEAELRSMMETRQISTSGSV